MGRTGKVDKREKLENSDEEEESRSDKYKKSFRIKKGTADVLVVSSGKLFTAFLMKNTN